MVRYNNIPKNINDYCNSSIHSSTHSIQTPFTSSHDEQHSVDCRYISELNWLVGTGSEVRLNYHGSNNRMLQLACNRSLILQAI